MPPRARGRRCGALRRRPRRGTPDRCRTRTRSVSNPPFSRRSQALSFHAMSRSTSPTTPRARHPRAIQRDERIADAGSTSLRRREILEGGPHAGCRRRPAMPLPAERGGVEPDAVHVGVDQVRRRLAGGGIQRSPDPADPATARRGTRADGRLIGLDMVDADDRARHARRTSARPSGRAARPVPTGAVHVGVPESRDEPSPVRVEHLAARTDRSRRCDVGDQPSATKHVDRPVGRQQPPAGAAHLRSVRRCRTGPRRPESGPSLIARPAHLGGQGGIRVFPSPFSVRRSPSTVSAGRFWLSFRLATTRRGEPESDGPALMPLDVRRRSDLPISRGSGIRLSKCVDQPAEHPRGSPRRSRISGTPREVRRRRSSTSARRLIVVPAGRDVPVRALHDDEEFVRSESMDHSSGWPTWPTMVRSSRSGSSTTA